MKALKSYHDIELAEDSVLVYQPRFIDDARTRVAAIVRLPNGQLLEVEKSYDDLESRFVRDIRLQYSNEEILEFTLRENALLAIKEQVEKKAEERRLQLENEAQTFRAKAQAFEIEDVKNFSDKTVIRRLRKAQSPLEVAAIVSFILGKSFQSES